MHPHVQPALPAIGCLFALALAIAMFAPVSSTPLILIAAVVHGLAWRLRGPRMAAHGPTTSAGSPSPQS